MYEYESPSPDTTSKSGELVKPWMCDCARYAVRHNMVWFPVKFLSH